MLGASQRYDVAFLSLDRTLSSFCLLHLLFLLVILRQLHALGASFWQKLADTLLVDFVLGVLASTEQLGEPGASLEED